MLMSTGLLSVLACVRRRLKEYDHAGGDVFVLAAAFFYSLSTVHLSRLAPSVPSLPLAAAKSLALAAVSLVWLGASVLNNVSPFKLIPGSMSQCTVSYDPVIVKWYGGWRSLSLHLMQHCALFVYGLGDDQSGSGTTKGYWTHQGGRSATETCQESTFLKRLVICMCKHRCRRGQRRSGEALGSQQLGSLLSGLLWALEHWLPTCRPRCLQLSSLTPNQCIMHRHCPRTQSGCTCSTQVITPKHLGQACLRHIFLAQEQRVICNHARSGGKTQNLYSSSSHACLLCTLLN